MKPKTTVAPFAFDKVSTRLSLTPEEVASIIDGGKVVPLGRENGLNRLHLLFYSRHDDEHFIAVQNEKSGEVVTILSIHQKFRWEITPTALSMATDLVVSGKIKEEPKGSIEIKKISSQIKNFRFVVNYYNNVTGHDRRCGVYVDASPFHFCFAKVLSSQKLRVAIFNEIKAKANSWETVCEVFFRFGHLHSSRGGIKPKLFKLAPPEGWS